MSLGTWIIGLAFIAGFLVGAANVVEDLLWL